MIGGAGFIADMVTSIKNNSWPKRAYFNGYRGELEYHIKSHKDNISAEQLLAIKQKIRLKFRKERRKTLLINIVVFTLLFAGLVLLIIFISNFPLKLNLPDIQ